MANPTYQGQAAASRTSWLSSLFGGGSTPNYAGQGQPVSQPSLFGGASPAYKPAPVAKDTSIDASEDGAACPIPSFAIVVPRPRCNEPQTDE